MPSSQAITATARNSNRSRDALHDGDFEPGNGLLRAIHLLFRAKEHAYLFGCDSVRCEAAEPLVDVDGFGVLPSTRTTGSGPLKVEAVRLRSSVLPSMSETSGAKFDS